MINIEFNPDTYTLEATGHAEHDENGKDIVCAAISTLFYTLAEALYGVKDMLKEDITFSDDDGNGYISCVPKEEYEANISLIYWTILKGFEIVSTTYEKNVTLKVAGV